MTAEPEPSAYARQLGANLRAVRKRLGWSLAQVEEKSGARWKAVVVASYERCDRALTVGRLAELCAFYGVPVSEVLPQTPLVTEAFTAITAAKDAQMEQMALGYETVIAELRARLAVRGMAS